jgi:hypothetical protein
MALALACLLPLAVETAAADGAAATASAQKGGNGAKSKRHGTRAKRHARKARRRAHRARRRARRQRLARRVRRMRARRNGRLRLADNVPLAKKQRKTARGDTGPVIDAGFENGLYNWNTAGVGDVIPAVTHDLVRSGAGSGRVVLTGGQERSELILGGDGGGSAENAIMFGEGDEAYYAFSFYIEEMVYGRPGGHNLIFQLKGDDDGSPFIGLQLWDYEGDDGESGGRGLWSHGDGMNGDRFLAPVVEQQWHDVVVHFRASGAGAGLYEVYFDGALVDAGSGVNTIPDAAQEIYIKNGLYRNPDEVSGTSAMRLDAAKLGPTLASVLPG